MIEDKVYRELLDNGLMLDHYFLMCKIKSGDKPLATKRVQGFLNLMIKKGYVDNGVLTEKGLDLVQNCDYSKTVVDSTGEKKMDAGTWALSLHKKCQDKLAELTGRKQVKAKIEKKEYSFLPNAADLARIVLKAMNMYKIKDYEKVERTILRYIEKCNASSHWFPLMGYYILKSGTSQMVTEMDEDEVIKSPKSTQKFV